MLCTKHTSMRLSLYVCHVIYSYCLFAILSLFMLLLVPFFTIILVRILCGDKNCYILCGTKNIKWQISLFDMKNMMLSLSTSRLCGISAWSGYIECVVVCGVWWTRLFVCLAMYLVAFFYLWCFRSHCWLIFSSNLPRTTDAQYSHESSAR